jgi:hypothetical protein
MLLASVCPNRKSGLPVPDLAFGFAFERHAIKAVHETFPDLIFQKSPFSQIDHDPELRVPNGSRRMATGT